jgi:PKD repeat protein
MINASRLAIDTSAASNIGALQLASDGKIYMAEYATTYLGVINDPDVYGIGCNFTDIGFSVAPKISQMGLPNIPDFWLETQYFPSAAFLSTDTSLCQKFCIDFSDLSTNSPTSWEWLFPGAIPASSTDQNPTNICYDNPGVFDVTLITSNTYGTDTLTLAGFITVYPTPPFPVISQNGNLLTCSPAATYQWQFNSIDVPGATNQSFTVTQTGFYTVNISDSNGCISSSTTYIEITGMDDLCTASNLFISPNPSSGNFRIEWADCFPSGDVKLEVRNTLGQVVFHDEGNEGQPFSKTIDLRYLPAAVYFLDLSIDEKRFQKKLILTK